MKLSVWIEAARPQTLAAAFVPVAVGASFAWYYQVFDLLASLVALFCAFMIQIGTNFANDYFDHKKGADTDERVGFKRATATGAVSSKAMLMATMITFLIAFAAGMYLVWHGGWIVLAIGIMSILFGILYTGGPFPLAYNGLGDLFVMIFFGIVAVNGTYFVNALEFNPSVLLASLAVGALAVNILVVNNLRDVDSDRKANKNTLGVFFGEQFLRYEYVAMLSLAYVTPLWYVIHHGFSLWILLPYLSIFNALNALQSVWYESDKPQLNATLADTAKVMAMYGVLFTMGVILQ